MEQDKTALAAPLRLTEEQRKAVDLAMDYARAASNDASVGPYFVIAGLAGTGKTTIINEIVQECLRAGLVPQVLTPTGKAASVLVAKGVKARTIHSFCYRFVEVDEEGRPEFSFQGISKAKRVLIVDEASMVDETVLQDLLSTGTTLILVGDQGQLPPVSRDPKVLQSPDVTLQTIHRQALESPILRFAHAVREGQEPRPSTGGVEVRFSLEKALEIMHGLGSPNPTILVGTNGYRHKVNEMLHDPGDEMVRILVLRNNPTLDLYNGQVIDAKVLSKDGDGNPLFIKYLGEQIECAPSGWGATSPAGLSRPQDPHLLLCDYGYAITCHKAQGSEWDDVIVVEDWTPKDTAARWRYTAATRAKKNLVWVKS